MMRSCLSLGVTGKHLNRTGSSLQSSLAFLFVHQLFHSLSWPVCAQCCFTFYLLMRSGRNHRHNVLISPAVKLNLIFQLQLNWACGCRFSLRFVFVSELLLSLTSCDCLWTKQTLCAKEHLVSTAEDFCLKWLTAIAERQSHRKRSCTH